MRLHLPASILIAAAVATGASAQPLDRYGGVNSYPQGALGPSVAAPPARVLSWSGKTVPEPSPPQINGYGYGRYVQARPVYGAQLQPAPYAQDRGAPPPPYAVERRAALYAQPQPYYGPGPAPAAYVYPPPQGYDPRPQPYPPQQAYAPVKQQGQPAQPQGQPMSPEAMAAQMGPPQAAYPSIYQAQPYYAPAPSGPGPAPGSTATAPVGVYPANTVPPQMAGPQSLPPQVAQPMVTVPVGQGPLPPASIYAPPPQAKGVSAPQSDPTDPRQPQRVAMNTVSAPNQGSRLYSLHRDFGLQPDPDPAPLPGQGESVELVSSIDSGVSDPTTDETSPTIRKPKTAAAASNAAALRSGYPNAP